MISFSASNLNYKVAKVCMFLKASYFSILDEVREHDYSPTLPVIEDLQHVPSSGCHGPLGYDECLLLLVTLSIMIKERLALLCACDSMIHHNSYE